ncbi:MAG TPA: prolyl oligopeptidase family serine peptidase [Ramlibacter sp.]|nr:prolyl oligopeptidase family serine peptidase [Ramlibacter sp.]
MDLKRVALLSAAVALAGLSACSTAPTAPALVQAERAAQLPPLIPVRRFVANIDFAGGYQLSPDGARLLWSQTVGTDAGLAVRAVADSAGAATFATGFLPRFRPGTIRYTWLPDSRHVAYIKDLSGDENTQIQVIDTQSGLSPWQVTPWPGVRSYIVSRGAPDTPRFLFASNRRDRSSMDLFEADAVKREVREVARNDGHVTSWVIGADHRLAGRARQLGSADGSDVAIELLQPDGGWRLLRTVKAFDEFWFNRVDLGAGKAWAASNIGRDKLALVEIDLASGRETVIAQDPLVDVAAPVLPPLRGGPVAFVAHPGLPVITYLDAQLGTGVRRAVQQALARGLIDAEPVITRPQSTALDGRRMVLRAEGDFDAAELLLDRTTGEVTRLNPKEANVAALLSPERPFSFAASDGRTIHGYLVKPRGATGPVPLVVEIHGGPWARDLWRPATFNGTQLLANRGYAVLSVNYRGSRGYGREFMMAGNEEYFGRMQKDVAEAAQWAIDQGIADPKRMAVLGASFGGFSVMAQLIRKDQDWRCGVNVVGVANWARVIENWPPFWRNRHYFEALLGDVKKPQDRARMVANSPVSHVDSISAPMLVIHGANDIRVLRQDSDDIVAGLQKLGRPVDYLSFPNEGHSVARWRNRLEMWRRIEDTLAGCLGGRSAGWDFYQLMPR